MGTRNKNMNTVFKIYNKETLVIIKIDDADKYFIDMYGNVNRIEYDDKGNMDLILQTHLAIALNKGE